MNKEGEITSFEIVLIVIAIAGFAIILVVMYNVFMVQDVDEETCRLSVLSRATLAAGGAATGTVQNYIPLKCSSQKICFVDDTSGGSGTKSDNCMINFGRDKGMQIISLKGTNDEKRRTIESTIADSMYRCWSMLGEGKLDFAGGGAVNYGFAQAKSRCLVCSRIAMDKSVNPNVLFELKRVSGSTGAETQKLDIIDYMRREKVPGTDLTYLQAFTDKSVKSYANIKATSGDFGNTQVINDYINKWNMIIQSSADSKEFENKFKIIQEEYKKSSIYNSEIAILFSQIKAKSIGEVWTNLGNAGATIAAGTFVTAFKFGGVKGVVTLGKAIFSPIGGLIAEVAIAGTLLTSEYNAVMSQNFAAGYCGPFANPKATVGARYDEAAQGCSVVQMINYNFKQLNMACDLIEGNP